MTNDLNKRFARLVEIAYAMADNRSGRCHHISVIQKCNRILSIGYNKYNKTNSLMKKYGYSSLSGVHAELDAAIKYGETSCRGLTLINIRIDGRNKLNLSKPCKFCARLIKDLNFKNVYYTDGTGNFVEEI